MKKIALLFIITTLAATTWAQNLSTVKGKTKDGKTFQVDYYHGAIEDYIENVKYSLVDELKAKVTQLQTESKDLRVKLDAANKRAKELEGKEETKNSKEVNQFQEEINNKEAQINGLNEKIKQLQSQIDTTSSANRLKELKIQQLQEEIAEKDRQLESREKTLKTQAVGAGPYIAFEAALGKTRLGNSVSEGWNQERGRSFQAALYYGTARLTSAMPLSLEAGLGIHKVSMAVARDSHTLMVDTKDIDGCPFQAQYSMGALQEAFSATYLTIPLRVCLGQPMKNNVSVYAKLGLTPSLKIGAAFEGNGKYTLKAYYERWHVTLEDIEELGLVSNQERYNATSAPTVKGFVLWGDVALGVYIPFGNLPLQMTAGVKIDYPLTSLATASEASVIPESYGLFGMGGKVFSPSANLGLIYTFK